MIALGIDPGTRRIGFGVVEMAEKNGRALKRLDAGILDIRSTKSGTVTDDSVALAAAKNETVKLIKKYRPEIVCVERLFFSKNQKTAMAVSQARGAVLLAAHETGIKIREYAPNEVKLGIAGYGSADKKAVLKMVRLILNEKNLDVIDDASDALALAIMGCNNPVDSRD